VTVPVWPGWQADIAAAPVASRKFMPRGHFLAEWMLMSLQVLIQLEVGELHPLIKVDQW